MKTYSSVPWRVGLFAATAPFVAVHVAYGINIVAGDALGCVPYLEGCTSISRGARSGPGLMIFRGLVIPSGVALAAMWLLLSDALLLRNVATRQQLRWQTRLGVAGAVFLILYATYLGESGAVYGWLRRYGVYGYFGFTALAQLLLLRIQPALPASASGIGRAIRGVVSTMWGLGLVFAFRPLFIQDPALNDRLGNAVEWIFALLLSVVIALQALLLKRLGLRLAVRLP